MPFKMENTKKNHLLLSLLKQRFSAFTRYSNQIIICLSENFLITEFNSAAEKLYHCRKKAVLGKNFFKIFTKQHSKKFSENKLKKITPAKPLRDYLEIILSKKNTE